MKKIHLLSVFGLLLIKELASTTSKGIKLYLYDTLNFDTPKLLNYTNIKSIDINVPFKIIVHGWNASSQIEWYKVIKDEYLLTDDFNVIQVDWSDWSMRDYYSAAKCAEYVGNSLGEVLHYISVQTSLSLDAIHMIGHSIGAHICGHAGRTIKKLTGKKVQRITALDPAAPFYESMAIFQPLSRTNARIVDVIHTDGGIFGYLQPIGTTDFFPNGGQRPMPECPSIFSEKADLEEFVWCSHTESIAYFIASINNVTFVGNKCESWKDYVKGICDHDERAIMGEDFSQDPGYHGNYYLITF